MKEPVDHILRPPLPWRADVGITECGLNAERVPTINRAQYAERLKSMGKQRVAMFTCITCSQTAERWGTWDEDPLQALQREMEWEGMEAWRSRRVRDELLAIAALIEEHRGEFEDLVLAVQQRREWLAKKAAREETARAKPKRPEPW